MSPVMGSGSGNERLKIGVAVVRDVRSRPWRRCPKAIVIVLIYSRCQGVTCRANACSVSCLAATKGNSTTYKPTGLASTMGLCKPSSGVSALPISKKERVMLPTKCFFTALGNRLAATVLVEHYRPRTHDQDHG